MQNTRNHLMIKFLNLAPHEKFNLVKMMLGNGATFAEIKRKISELTEDYRYKLDLQLAKQSARKNLVYRNRPGFGR